MLRRIIALGTFFVLIAAAIFFSYRLVLSPVMTGVRPTQTSIFSGLPIDDAAIDDLFQPQWNGKINREQAIGLAEWYCATMNSIPADSPTNIEANLLTEDEANTQLSGEKSATSTRKVWLVTMDGLWEHEGPVPEKEPAAPIRFSHCGIMIDAGTGEMIRLRNTGQQ